MTVSTEVSKYMGNAVKITEIWGDLVINVKSSPYLAKGDWNGTTGTDDTVAIQKAIDYAISIGKQEVTFPPGWYKYTVLTNTSGITFIGDGVTLSGTTPITLTSLAELKADIAQRAINVKSSPYNAKGDGITDDTGSFQAANDYLTANGGGVIFVPEGVYLANFILDSNITIKGNGVNVSIIKSVAGSNADVIKGRDFDTYTGTTADVTTEGLRFISIQDITIDGNKDNNTSGYGIRIWGCYWYFNNVIVQFCKNDGIWTEFTSVVTPTEANVRNQVLESMFRNIKILYCNGNAWTYYGPHDSIIDNYVAVGNSGWALYQRDFNSFLTGENWNSWKNGNGYYVGTGLAGHDIVADNDGTGTGLEFKSTGGNSRIVNARFSGFVSGIILRGQAQHIKGTVQSCTNAVKVESLSLSHLDLVALLNDVVLNIVSEISKNSFIVTASVPGGKVLQSGVAIRSDSFALLNSGGTGMMQLAENSLKVKGWTFTFPTNNGVLLTDASAPTTTARGGIKTQSAVPDVSAAPTAGEFNTLLSRLRAAGILA